MSDQMQRLQSAIGDRYRIECELGRGGMATVFLAEDLRHHRSVAIKVLDPDVASAVGAERFSREIESVARLTHPHVLPLHDSGEAGGLLYYVMPYVAGESLRHRIAREGPLPVDDALRLVREVADGLEFAHRAGLVHRDIKPENVLVEAGHAVIADFGLARALDGPAPGRLTTVGSVVGTPAYMSPEQAAGGREVDARSDQYSLACMLYEMLAGVPPFVGPSPPLLIRQHLTVAPRPVTELRAAVPPAVSEAIARALAKVPADRHASVAEFAAALVADVPSGTGEPARRAALESATTVEMRDAGVSAAPSAPRRHARSLPIAFALGAIVIAAVAFFAWQRWGPARPAAPTAKSWILVAEFEAPRDEPDLAPAARGLLSAALDESGIVMTVPPDQVALALGQTGRPDSTRVDARLARELAYRNSIRSVLEGRIHRIGSGYQVVVRLSDSGTDSTLMSLDGTARDKDALVATLDALARRMRRQLGEDPDIVRATRGLVVAMTPSFEAYRRFEAIERYVGETGDYAGGLEMDRSALALDPDFATLYGEMAVSYQMIGRPDSAMWAVEQALARPQRLTDEQRLHFEARRALHKADYPRALELRGRQVQLYPNGPKAFSAYHERALVNGFLGRYEQAVMDARNGIAHQPIGPAQVTLQILAGAQINAGQLDSAVVTLASMRGWWRQQAAVRIAVARGDWAQAESLCTNPPPDVAASASFRSVADGFTVALRARRGEVREALRFDAARPRRPSERSTAGRTAMLYASVLNLPPTPLPAALDADTTIAATITRGSHAAQAGDLAAARRGLADLRRRGADDRARAGAAAEFLDAAIAARERRWQDVVRLIGPTALRGDDRGVTPSWGRIGPLAERWLVADAYDRLGMADSAAVAFERVLALPESWGITGTTPYAHQRLVLLDARLGRGAEAEQHWQAFSAAFTNPDPELRHLLDEARAAMQRLR